MSTGVCAADGATARAAKWLAEGDERGADLLQFVSGHTQRTLCENSMITPKPRSGGRPHNAVMQRLASDPAWMAQAKIDGWRARWRDGELRSRAGLSVAPVPSIDRGAVGARCWPD